MHPFKIFNEVLNLYFATYIGPLFFFHSINECESELVLPALKYLFWVPMRIMCCHFIKKQVESPPGVFHSSGSKLHRLNELSPI